MVDPELIRKRILAEMPDAQVEVADTTGGGDHFSVKVVSGAFRNLPRVQQHQRVYRALGELMAGSAAPIHALALQTSAPD